MSTPYSQAPNASFWSRAVSNGWAPAHLLAGKPVLLRQSDRIMSAGSCFAAHIIPYLEQAGHRYVRTEKRHPAFSVPPENFGYDNFSAAYGNIYTVRQLLQTLRRARGQFKPVESAWVEDDRIVDPFRPGLRYKARTPREHEALTAQHLARFIDALAQATVFIFTLGLTEAWVSAADGAVFPACPGTVAGTFDPERHKFVNFGVGEVVADLNAFIREARELNRELRFILTVSPVPLVATATGRHVLEANTFSKSVLRVAADEVAACNSGVTYFPSYEIVTGPQAPHAFFEADRRNVSADGVNAVMAAFLSHCEAGAKAPAPPSVASARAAPAARTFGMAECEEMMSDAEQRLGPDLRGAFYVRGSGPATGVS